MDGWEFLEQYAERKSNEGTIIYMLSTSVNPDDVLRAKKISSVKGFLHKPLTAKDLNLVLEKHYQFLIE